MTWAKERLDGLVARKLEPPPVVKTLKLGLIDAWGVGWVRKRWEPEPDLLNGDGGLFGGYLAALADQMSALAAMSVLPDRAMYRAASLDMQYFRLGAAQTLDLEARVLAQTRRLISVEVDIRRADEALIARGAAQHVVIGPPQDAAVM